MSELEKKTSSLRKKRGIIRSSITRAKTRLRDLEAKTTRMDTRDHAQRMLDNLENLDSDFKQYHYALIELIDDEETLEEEQENVDKHDDEIAELVVSYKQLLSVCTVSLDVDDGKIISRKMKHLHKGLSIVKDSIVKHPDLHVLHQHEEDLRDYKKELSDVRNDLLSLVLKEEDKLSVHLSALECAMFDWWLEVHKSISDSDHHAPSNGKGVKLPKLEVPTFNGNIIH